LRLALLFLSFILIMSTVLFLYNCVHCFCVSVSPRNTISSSSLDLIPETSETRSAQVTQQRGPFITFSRSKKSLLLTCVFRIESAEVLSWIES
jgi:hypothetical protein